MPPARPAASRSASSTTGAKKAASKPVTRAGAGRPKAAAPARFAPKLRWADNTPIDSDDARGRIVAAAVECVMRFGVEKTGMEDVARAAMISRPTVYKYFGSRNELITAVFLWVLDQKLDRGLETFFDDVATADDLRDSLADAAVHVITVLREDETIQSILYGSSIPPDVLLAETAQLLVGVLRVSLTRSVASVMTGDLLPLLRPTSLDLVAGWIIRVLYAFLAWPGETPEEERQMFRDYLAPIFLRDID